MGNININGKTAVHAKSDGILTTVDTCMTPPYCVPINYTNIAESKMTDMGASSVKIQGSPACNNKSNFKISKGDAPGCCGGTGSGTTQQMAEFITFSNDVMIEGKPAVRNSDKMVSNLKNTPPQPLQQPPAGEAKAGKAKAPEAIKGDYSQQVDLSDFVGMNPESGQALQSLPYVFKDKDGKVLQTGQTNRHGDTQRVETVKEEELILYVGSGDWNLLVD
ncbi:MAG: DUF4150 domain-containing protein [Sideroxyarcus sp.]|nr:DUF4150 domain-containing protein [Sideroxyarcus sp.]